MPQTKLPWIRWIYAILAIGFVWLIAYFLSKLLLHMFPALASHTNTLGQISAALLLAPVLVTEIQKLELARARNKWSKEHTQLKSMDREKMDQILDRTETELAKHRAWHLGLYLLGLFGVMFTLAIGLL